MELGLSLGEAPKASSFVAKLTNMNKNMNMNTNTPSSSNSKSRDSSFCIPLLSRFSTNNTTCNNNHDEDHDDPSVQLHLVPPNPPPPPPARLAIPWLSPTTLGGDEHASERVVSGCRGLDVNVEDGEDDLSSPNSDISSFRIIGGQKRDQEADRGSDDDENGGNRKKLRLSKQQSAFLEDTFKQHSTLNPKQKLALAKQLNLRPRQVEVWFQNRRARTKLKQTEVDCEYLKKCCETLTEENRRLQKEVQELRALKTSQPYYMQLPATTLTMCPSCEKVVSKPSAAAPTSANRIPVALSLG